MDSRGQFTGPLAKLPGWIQQSLQVRLAGGLVPAFGAASLPCACKLAQRQCSRVAGKCLPLQTSAADYCQATNPQTYKPLPLAPFLPCRCHAALVRHLESWLASAGPWRQAKQAQQAQRQRQAQQRQQGQAQRQRQQQQQRCWRLAEAFPVQPLHPFGQYCLVSSAPATAQFASHNISGAYGKETPGINSCSLEEGTGMGALDGVMTWVGETQGRIGDNGVLLNGALVSCSQQVEWVGG